MTTIQEITGRDGDVWTLECAEGDLFLLHTFSEDYAGPRTCIPIDAVVLEMFALAARDRTARVVQFPKIVPAAVRKRFGLETADD